MEKRELNPALLGLLASKKKSVLTEELARLYLDSLEHRMQVTPKEDSQPKQSSKSSK